MNTTESIFSSAAGTSRNLSVNRLMTAKRYGNMRRGRSGRQRGLAAQGRGGIIELSAQWSDGGTWCR